jgi:GTP cyclohydrolase IA
MTAHDGSPSQVESRALPVYNSIGRGIDLRSVVCIAVKVTDREVYPTFNWTWDRPPGLSASTQHTLHGMPIVKRTQAVNDIACNDWCDDGESTVKSTVDMDRIRKAVREILAAVGENPDREGLLETPDRMARMYAELFSGLHADPREHLRKTFTVKHDEMVVQKDIDFSSVCEHHLLPFMGKAHIAYLPSGKVVGLSKLARVVEVVSHRPQVQERMTEEIADLVMHELGARGVGVIIEATHTCMTIRGVRKPGSICITSAMRGGFQTNPATRMELMALVTGNRVGG